MIHREGEVAIVTGASGGIDRAPRVRRRDRGQPQERVSLGAESHAILFRGGERKCR